MTSGVEVGSSGEGVGARQFAPVRASTSFRTKKRGKVPPRFDTLNEGVSKVHIHLGDGRV